MLPDYCCSLKEPGKVSDPLLVPETPWDAGGIGAGGGGTVLYDRADELFKSWFLCEPAISKNSWDPHSNACGRMLDFNQLPSKSIKPELAGDGRPAPAALPGDRCCCCRVP